MKQHHPSPAGGTASPEFTKAASRRLALRAAAVETLERRQLLATISGVVWDDVNTNRRFDAGEATLSGWTVYLDSNKNGALDPAETFTFTDADGRYSFTGLPTGNYQVGIVLDAGYGQTYPSFSGARASEFTIDLNFTGTTSDEIKSIFQNAAARWSEVIVGDVPDEGAIDDIQLDVTVTNIDGAGGILGQASPTAFRTEANGGLPYQGFMQFDVADSDPADPVFFETVLHEMGHALGFVDQLWETKGLLSGVSARGNSSDPRFLGPLATAQYNAIFGNSEVSVPLEPGFRGDGSAISHWRESVFGDELMSPYASAFGNAEPLSRITAAAMGDLGYVVNIDAADDYDPTGAGSPATTPLIAGTKPFQFTVNLSADDQSVNVADFGVRLDTKPRIGSVQVGPAIQQIGNTVLVQATGVLDFEGDPIRGVVFYRESNGLPGLQTGANGDTYIGIKTKQSKGRWIITAPTDGLVAGDVTFYARATDDLGLANTRAGTGTLVDPQTIPAKPTGLNAEIIGTSQVQLTWNDQSGDESGFRVERSLDPNFRRGVATYFVGQNVESLLIDDQPAASTYYYRVRAYNTAGNSPATGTSATTLTPGEKIVDSRDASLKGTWGTTASSTNGTVNGSYIVNDTTSFARATFTPTLDYADAYFVYLRFPSSPANATNVPVDIIIDGEVKKTVIVNQQTSDDGYVLLGKFNLPVGDRTSVRVRNTGANGIVAADAVRFLPANPPA
jgi:hypothetical protein